jgi:hypothetical protein
MNRFYFKKDVIDNGSYKICMRDISQLGVWFQVNTFVDYKNVKNHVFWNNKLTPHCPSKGVDQIPSCTESCECHTIT